MQKKLIALAVASAMAAPVALADVTVYGKMDVSYNFIDNDTTDVTGAASALNFEDDNQSINSNSSRLGFKGSEDLGGGLKANFQIESAIKVDGDGTGLNQRNTWAGLSGGWGEVRLGRHDTPFKIAGRKTDLYESEQLGENRAVFNQPVSIATTTTAGTDTGLGYDIRARNALAYFTPNFSGFQGAVAYIPEEGIDDGDAWSVAAFYGNGPLFLTVAYEQLNEGASGVSSSVLATGTDEQTAWRFGGAYTFGDFKFSGLYQMGKDEAGVDGLDHDAWWLGGQYTFGNNQAMVTYGQSDYDNVAGFTDDREFDVWTIGLNHNFSKRTMLYARYASLDNESGSGATLNSSGFDNGDGNSDQGVTDLGGESSGFSVGMRHKF
ncbi:MAG: porin [Gammaproteobacteria bacterium]|nr:porin [Gammaproteobacteria bacterium]